MRSSNVAILAESFKKALGNIEPQREHEGDDAKNAKLAHEEVRQVLKGDSKLKLWGVDPILIGSYARSVSIRRIKDVDVFGRLTSPPASLLPGAALDEFERVLSAEYGERCVKQFRSYKIEFPEYDLSVDAVPARAYGANWQLPSRKNVRAEWLETNPIRLGELTTAMNADERFVLGERGVYVPMVKLIRQTRRAVLGSDSQPGGLFLELMALQVFTESMEPQRSYAGYLAATLRGIADLFPSVVEHGLDDPTIDGKKISTKATSVELQDAAEKFADAADLAQDALDEADTCESAENWAQLLGDNCDGPVFDLPTFCTPKAKVLVAAAVAAAAAAAIAAAGRRSTAGADRVPAGSGRYA
jgi:hypothetical protein